MCYIINVNIHTYIHTYVYIHIYIYIDVYVWWKDSFVFCFFVFLGGSFWSFSGKSTKFEKMSNNIDNDMDGWGKWTTGNCARSLNLTIRTICTTQNPSWEMRRTKFSGILRCKRTEFQSNSQSKKKKKKTTGQIVDFAGRLQGKTERKQKEK